MMLLAFTLLFLTLHLAAMRNEIMRRRVRTMLMHAGGRRGGRCDDESRSACGFIVSAYAAAIAIVAGLVAWVVIDRRQLNARARRARSARRSRGARSARSEDKA